MGKSNQPKIPHKNYRWLKVTISSLNSFNAKQVLDVNGKEYTYFSLPEAEKMDCPEFRGFPIR